MGDGRVMVDCSAYPNEVGCTLQISGREEEVLDAAVMHAVAVHGHEESEALRDDIRGMLQPA